MALTLAQIEAASDDELVKELRAELAQRLKKGDGLVALKRLPPGLRAMELSFQLDVSMGFDDLGWHFFNNHDRKLAEATIEALRELGAERAAEIFAEAYRLMVPHWRQISRDPFDFGDWYRETKLVDAMKPLNQELWQLIRDAGKHRLMQYWPAYARRHPERELATDGSA
jgi:hypothetical protein